MKDVKLILLAIAMIGVMLSVLANVVCIMSMMWFAFAADFLSGLSTILMGIGLFSFLGWFIAEWNNK